MPDSSSLRKLDDKVLGPPGSGRPAWKGVLRTVVQISRLVLTALAVVLVAGILVVVLPTNEKNVIVKQVLDAALQVAGPFATVFDIANRSLRAAANFGLGAAIYLLVANLLGRLPGVRS